MNAFTIPAKSLITQGEERTAAAKRKGGVAGWFGNLVGAAKALRAQGVDVIDLGLGEPDFPTPAHVTDAAFKARAVAIKEERSNMVKEHLWVLWTDYFKAPHFEKYPELHDLFNSATKLAGAAGTKGTTDVAVADDLLAKIDRIAEIFWATKAA